MFWFSAIGATLSLLGNVMLIFKKRAAFWVWTVGNLAWIIYGLWGEHNLPLVAMNAVYVATNTASWFKWGRRSAKHD